MAKGAVWSTPRPMKVYTKAALFVDQALQKLDLVA